MNSFGMILLYWSKGGWWKGILVSVVYLNSKIAKIVALNVFLKNTKNL